MKNTLIPLGLITLAAAVVLRLLLESPFGQGTLVYIIVPFVISVALYMYTRRIENAGVWTRYLRHMLLATVIFFATSGILLEGFVCVLIFLPIYYFFVTIAYAIAAGREKRKERGNIGDVFRAYSLPAIVFMLASEGLLPSLVVPRDRTATYVTVTDQNIAVLKHNMAAPISFPAERNWFLKLFPLPDKIAAGSLGAGDVHNLHFTYRKWVFGNEHKGEMDVLIAEVEPEYIRTEITKNTAYLSHYMEVKGTDVYFKPLENGQTEVSLTVKYKRLLAPAWYFGPMQQFAAEQSAKYLMDTIIIRKTEDSDG